MLGSGPDGSVLYVSGRLTRFKRARPQECSVLEWQEWQSYAVEIGSEFGKIATGDIEDTKTEKNPHAVALGKLGGSKRRESTRR
jgi:hypothetical protein